MKNLLAYLQLLRLPNLFTAMADIFMGFLISHGTFQPISEFCPLLAASSCMYLAGMVLNDWFDIEVDRVERPERPLPSGRIAATHALVLGVVLLAREQIRPNPRQTTGPGRADRPARKCLRSCGLASTGGRVGRASGCSRAHKSRR